MKNMRQVNFGRAHTEAALTATEPNLPSATGQPRMNIEDAVDDPQENKDAVNL